MKPTKTELPNSVTEIEGYTDIFIDSAAPAGGLERLPSNLNRFGIPMWSKA